MYWLAIAKYLLTSVWLCEELQTHTGHIGYTCKISLGVPVGRYYIQCGYQWIIIIGNHTCGTWYHSLIAISNICQATGLYIRKIIVGTYTYSDSQFLYIFSYSKRNLCTHVQISTDLNISNGIMSFKNSSHKFLVPGNFGNPKQYFNFCRILGLKCRNFKSPRT